MLGIVIAALGAASQIAPVSATDVFQAGVDGYHTYRIPALIAPRNGALLAFCEGRRKSTSDSGEIHLLVKRSADRGATWSTSQVVAEFGSDTIGNPAPVVERKSGVIFLLLTRNPGNITEKQIIDGSAPGTRTVWITRSRDNGSTWSAPVEITASVKRENWTWYATGPGNGIQLRTGRLVIPCDHIERGTKARRSHVIYSDDRGETWKIGGVADVDTNESAVVELRDGSLLLNMRSYAGQHRRAIARSVDGGLTWSKTELDQALIEPVCQASLIRATLPGKKSDGRLIFSNPASTKRDHMTVRISRDDGKTWAESKLIDAGPSAYSSLAALDHGEVGLLFEHGEKSAYERVTFQVIRVH